MNIKFSIIIPLYNKENCIQKTVESVLNQTYKDFELIIVNDGSTDRSIDVVKLFSDDRIRIIDKPNGGVSSARNRGMQEAKNEWITFLDADDIMYEYALEVYMYLHRKYKDCSVLVAATESSKFKYRSTDNHFIVKNYYKENVYSCMKFRSYLLCTDCICINKCCYQTIGGFSEKLKHGEDLEYWYRLSQHYCFAKIERVVSFYNLEAENRSVSSLQTEENSWGFYETLFNTPPTILSPFYIILIHGHYHYDSLFKQQSVLNRTKYYIMHLFTISTYVPTMCLFRLITVLSYKNGKPQLDN